MTYRLLADLVVAIHVAYVAFVFFGLIGILVGHALGWTWVRHRGFRLVHLAMIVGVVLRSALWNECPLTWWERDLRELAGQVEFEGSPIGKVLHDLIHPDLPLWVFPVIYSLFGGLVVATLWLVPVQWRPRPRLEGLSMRAGLLVLGLLTILDSRALAQEPIFAPGSKLEVVAGKGQGGEGPAWHPRLGILSSGNGHINRVDRTGKVSIWRKDAGTNGLLFDSAGRLIACEPVQRRVTRTEQDGTITVLTDRFEGKRYNQPNDLTIDSRGRIYFTDPRYGDRGDMQLRDETGRTIEGVYRIDPDGKVTRILGREVDRPNGILVSSDERHLFVADNNNDTVGKTRKLWRFDLRKDGSVDPASRKLLHDWGKGRGPDGLKQDEAGRLYVAGGLNKPNPPAEPATDVKGGIYVFSAEGKLLTFLPVPTDEVTNCAFGDDDRKTLYITGGGVLYRIRTTTAGRLR
ncbi:MAG: DUF2784 family protein [Gemmataceae bacterium]